MFLIPRNTVYYDKREMKRKEVDDVLADGETGGEVVEGMCGWLGVGTRRAKKGEEGKASTR